MLAEYAKVETKEDEFQYISELGRFGKSAIRHCIEPSQKPEPLFYRVLANVGCILNAKPFLRFDSIQLITF